MQCSAVKILFLTLNSFALVQCSDFDRYIKFKQQLMHHDQTIMPGHNIQFTSVEKEANEVFMELKANEPIRDYTEHYFKLKRDLSNSRLLSVIREMPKGAILNVHDYFFHTPEYLMQITYDFKYLYYCASSKRPIFRFSRLYPYWTDRNDPCNGSYWRLIEDERKKKNSKIDKKLRKYFHAVPNYDVNKYPDKIAVINKMGQYLNFILPLITYDDVWEKYLTDALKKFLKDGAIYVEIRTCLPPLYTIFGQPISPMENAKKYRKVINSFKKNNTNFIGAGLIYVPQIVRNVSQLETALKEYKRIRNETHSLWVGFDLFWLYYPHIDLLDYAKVFSESKIPLFLSVGATKNHNDIFDRNLVHAVALRSKRLSNAFSLAKHPTVMDYIKTEKIALEISVLSNQIFYLIRDLQEHPLAIYLAEGLPVVLAGEMFNVWKASPVSDEFFLTLVAVGNANADMKLLKQLALNSIIYSSLRGKTLQRAHYIFNKLWRDFVNSMILNRKKINKIT